PALLLILPPFPTRRSSDLARVAGEAVELACQPVALLLHLAQRRLHVGELLLELRLAVRQPGVPRIDLLLQVVDLALPTVDRRRQDRKSTRLNSSHGSISYA